MTDSQRSVLVFVEGWGSGGIESVVMDTLRSDAYRDSGLRARIFSICDWSDRNDKELEVLVVQRSVLMPGVRKPGLIRKLVVGIPGFWRELSACRYDVVHINATNGLLALYSFLAWMRGVPIRVLHAHNSDFDDAKTAGLAKVLGHRMGRALFTSFSTARIACSAAAGLFQFGRDGFEVVPNGVNVHRFAFDAGARKRVRREFGVGDATYLLGSVGRIDRRKNPLFQIDVFAAVRALMPDVEFVMIGSGDEEDVVRARVESLGLVDVFHMVPSTQTPEEYYAALDLLLMPSLMEGFPLAALEAQCAGLPVLASDAVPAEVGIGEGFARVSLDESSIVWADAAVRLLSDVDGRARILGVEGICRSHLDSGSMAREIVARWVSDRDMYSGMGAVL